MREAPTDRARLSIREEADVVIARRCARELALRLGQAGRGAEGVGASLHLGLAALGAADVDLLPGQVPHQGQRAG